MNDELRSAITKARKSYHGSINYQAAMTVIMRYYREAHNGKDDGHSICWQWINKLEQGQ